MRDFIRSVDLKLVRAEVQASALANSISAWASKNPISGACELRESRLGYRLIVENFRAPPPIDDWGLLLGECVHNLRSSLDNLAFALARLSFDPPKHPSRIAFPIFGTRVDFDRRGRTNVDQIPKEAAALIELIQPFQRDGSPGKGTPDLDPLVHLQRLSNTDKHRIPPVVLIAPETISHSVQVEFHSDEDAAANVSPDATVWAGPIKPGVVLLEHKTNCPIASVSGRFEGQAVLSIQTSQGFEPVEPYLLGIRSYTALVVDQFRQFF